MRPSRNSPILWILAADFRAARCKLSLDAAIEVIGVRTLGLEFPRYLRSGKHSRQENLAVGRPRRHVRSAAAVSQSAVGGSKPLRLAARYDAVLGTIRPADANVGPVVAG